MPAPEIGAVPFQEAINHFRGKLDIPTRRFDDMMGEAHAKAFTVAGAMKMDLLTDIRASIDQAISSGTTITDFRKDFDAAVQKHGWSYKGKRGWRTRVIYDTNLRTAHMAGRWQQFQQVKDTRPFLQYQTVGDRRVRPQHAAWDYLVLHIDDDWWNTHYPPNGWGCRCTVRSLSVRQMRRDKLEPGNAPSVKTTERINASTGEVYGDVPEGIDTGWDYNVGKAWLGPDLAFGKKAVPLPSAVRSTVVGNTKVLSDVFAKPYQAWAKEVLKRDRNLGEIRTVGYMNHKTIGYVLNRGEKLDDATITISDKQLRRMQVPKNRRRGKNLFTDDELLKIPEHIARPRAILWDLKRGVLVYAFDTDQEAGKILVEVGFRKKREISNSVISGSRVRLENLRDTNHYEVIDGEL